MIKFTEFLNELYTRLENHEYYLIPTDIKREENEKIAELMECFYALLKQKKVIFNLDPTKTSNMSLFKDSPEFKPYITNPNKKIKGYLKILSVIKPEDFRNTSNDGHSIAFEFRIYKYVDRLGLKKVRGKNHLYIKIKFTPIIVLRDAIFKKKVKKYIEKNKRKKKKYALTTLTSDEELILVDANISKIAVLSIHF